MKSFHRQTRGARRPMTMNKSMVLSKHRGLRDRSDVRDTTMYRLKLSQLSLSLSLTLSFPLLIPPTPPLPSPPFYCNSPPPPPSLSLSYSTNCCWSSVFCVAGEIFQYALHWTMPRLSCEQTKAGRRAMNNADFSIDSLYATESCFMLWDLIFTLTRHTVFTDVLLPCMINATALHVSAGSGGTKTFPLYRLFLQLRPAKSQWGDRMRSRASTRCCKGVESGVNCCQRYGTVSRWPVTASQRVVLSSCLDPRTSRYPHSRSRGTAASVCEHGAQLGFQHPAPPMMHL